MIKPTLQEIANMPFPDSQHAMRAHYNPEWGYPVADDAELSWYEVRVEYSYQSFGSVTYKVRAQDREEADDLAGALFEGDKKVEEGAEWLDSEIREVDGE